MSKASLAKYATQSSIYSGESITVGNADRLCAHLAVATFGMSLATPIKKFEYAIIAIRSGWHIR